MLKLVDKPDLGSGALRRMGSSPFTRTRGPLRKEVVLFCFRKCLIFCPISQKLHFAFLLEMHVLSYSKKIPYRKTNSMSFSWLPSQLSSTR